MKYDKNNYDAVLAKMIIANVALDFGVNNIRVFSNEKIPAHLCYIRQSAIYLMHIVCQYSYARVGTAFNLHASTIAYACKTIENFRDDQVFDGKLVHLESCLQVNLAQFAIGSSES